MLELKHIFKGSTYYIYCVNHKPEGPWLDNGSNKTFWFHLDNNKLTDLKIRTTMALDDGGSEEYEFTNGKTLFIPNYIIIPSYAESFWRTSEPLKYGDNLLEVADITNKARTNVLKLAAEHLS